MPRPPAEWAALRPIRFSTHSGKYKDGTQDEQHYLEATAEGLLIEHPPVDDPAGNAVALAFMLDKLSDETYDEWDTWHSRKRGQVVFVLAVELYDDGGEAYLRSLHQAIAQPVDA